MADAPSITDGITRQMRYLAERQRVIAGNIANNETAGFKAREVDAPSFGDLLAAQGIGGGGGKVARPQVRLTAGMAALGARGPRAGGSVVLDRDVTETKPNGNNVTLEEQLLKMGQVQADFAAMTNLYRKHEALMKTALGRGGGG